MTRRDYEAIARALQAVRPIERDRCYKLWHMACSSIASELEKENPQFSRASFLRHCTMKETIL